MSDYTLSLADDWDLHITESGNLPTDTKAQGIAQNVANAVRLFTDDAYYFKNRGIPHFLIELRKTPRLNVLRSRIRRVALEVEGEVEGVKDAEVRLYGIDDSRNLNGIVLLTLTSGETATINLEGL